MSHTMLQRAVQRDECFAHFQLSAVQAQAADLNIGVDLSDAF
jgi:hypothetical protein